MSMETLKTDLAACIASGKELVHSNSPGDIVAHLNHTLWPFIESLVQEASEIDDSVQDMYEHAEDILQPETAQLLGGVLAGAMVLVGELRQRCGNDARLLKAISEWSEKAKLAAATIEEISIPPDDEEDEDTDDDGDDDGDDDDEDEDEGANPDARQDPAA